MLLADTSWWLCLATALACLLILQVMLYLLSKGAIVDLSDINDFTCLHAAAATGNLDIVNLLVGNSGHALVSACRTCQSILRRLNELTARICIKIITAPFCFNSI